MKRKFDQDESNDGNKRSRLESNGSTENSSSNVQDKPIGRLRLVLYSCIFCRKIYKNDLEHFEICDELKKSINLQNKECKLCQKSFMQDSLTSRNIKKHFEEKHPDILHELRSEKPRTDDENEVPEICSTNPITSIKVENWSDQFPTGKLKLDHLSHEMRKDLSGGQTYELIDLVDDELIVELQEPKIIEDSRKISTSTPIKSIDKSRIPDGTPKSRKVMEVNNLGTPKKEDDDEIIDITDDPHPIYAFADANDPFEVTTLFICPFCSQYYLTEKQVQKHVGLFHKIPEDTQKLLNINIAKYDLPK